MEQKFEERLINQLKILNITLEQIQKDIETISEKMSSIAQTLADKVY